MKKSLIFFLKLIVGLSLIFFIFSKIEWNEFINTVKRINPVYIYISIILFFIPGVGLSVLKWRKLLLVHNINVPFKQLYLYYLIGTFFNNFLPSTIGGDISRLAFLKSITNKTSESAASIIMERLTGLIGLIFLALFLLILNPSFIFEYLYIILIICSMLVAIYLFLNTGPFSKIIIKFKFLKVLWTKSIRLFDALYIYRNYKNVIVVTFFLSILFILAGALATYLYFLSIDIKVPLLKLVLIYVLAQLVGLLPISINSIGLIEGSYVVLFGLIGISSVDALTVALLGRVLLMLVSLSGGVVFIFQDKLIRV